MQAEHVQVGVVTQGSCVGVRDEAPRDATRTEVRPCLVLFTTRAVVI
jgi:hypothetical protein